jgi:4'-phosphopantetheinyl transferase
LTQTDADVPSNDEWLSKREMTILDGLRFAKRRADWRRGRWTAKCALASFTGAGFAAKAVEIFPNEYGAPEAFFEAKPFAASLSIAHSGDIALCAVSVGDMRLGCDVERIEPRDAAFAADYFTKLENVWLASLPEDERAAATTEIWSAKESVLKALQTGLRSDTRSVEVTFPNVEKTDWSPFEACVAERGMRFFGWRRRADGFSFTIVTDRPSDAPAPLTTETTHA